jgi:hypothetical protein
MVKKLLAGATGAAALVTDVARHAVWYLSHQVGGDPRKESPRAQRQRERDEAERE